MALSPLGLSLMQSQPIMPAHPGQIAPTNVLGAYQLSGNMAEQQYQAQLQQQNALYGGLAGLGAAGIIASPKLFGTGGPLANIFGSGPAAAAGASALPASLTGVSGGAASGLPSWLSSGALSGLPDLSGAGAAAAMPSIFDAGTTAVPFAADAGGSVAADLADLAAPAAVAGTDATADLGAGLASLLPFLFG